MYGFFMSALHKLNFWAVFSLVTSSQIGTGIFVSLVTLAPFGFWSVAGWAIAGIGAVALALVFAQLCSWMPRTGGPHVYIHHAFGPTLAFFAGWTYWVISWVSTTTVVMAAVSYLTPYVGHAVPVQLALGITLLIAITWLNCRGVSTAGKAEFVLTILKIVPLVFVPLIALQFFNPDHFFLDSTKATLPLKELLNRAVLIAFYGFIGLESATTPADSVENPSNTIPRAVVLGTVCVAGVYILNSIGIMGALPGEELTHSHAPYADVVQRIAGGNWHLLISLIASIICIGTLNAWMLTSGQISLGLTQDGFLPAFFGKTNRFGAPFISLIISCAGIIPLLIMTATSSLASSINFIIDVSGTTFLFVYALCCLAFFKCLTKQTLSQASLLFCIGYGTVALGFCVWVLYFTPLSTLMTASLFALSGIPFFIWFYSRKSGRL